ncbi:Asp-tRNA(Asn)/Glu-tRNA(Gln) amidotransferase subunit GatB [Mycoplasma phocimorsus]|uniref:Asp-tRNA(Asn)/Glu-tRNA(Gln) amidotransferase subunit GatB n=1 Tax=Mycoplasma phocimorsus TaxID=3045839 RepID=UPI0024BF25B7|nr:Asp-tRNA(Asn)/Glu-tRNA(Gln) amidotransferase subunit GatB [Mycoplasma phocimorsus]MDJ1648690.1 Asp-tRNA(Asn)/Glu-tRNA(Gln) amidotransferase subunit GatB [Mycoplasma phocimorsus]
MFEVIIGIEIHLQLSTKTKMFSPAKIDFNALPNTTVSYIDLAYPGTLPQVNKQAVINAIKLAKALNMQIDDVLKFDRKNYFYTDLPKGFQITQQFHPIGRNGKLSLNVNGKNKIVEIERIHLEEDTARQHHEGDFTFIDYNRAGIPLIEIVTKPVIHDADTAVKYIETIRQIALSQNISNAKMEQGSLRADINLSLRFKGDKRLGTKVEIKNINTLSNVKTAIEFEIKEQQRKLLANEKIMQCTKRFNEKTQQNILMRLKSDAVDYKYFPEPNIPYIKLSSDLISSAKLAELPWEKEERYKKANINEIYLNRLVNDQKLSQIFDNIDFEDLDKKSKIFFNEFVAYANLNQKHLSEINFNLQDISTSMELLEKGVISGKQLKKLVPLLENNQQNLMQLIKENDLMQISDEKILTDIINKILTPQDKLDYIQNPEKQIRMIVGKVMKETKSKANPVLTNELILKLLK